MFYYDAELVTYTYFVVFWFNVNLLFVRELTIFRCIFYLCIRAGFSVSNMLVRMDLRQMIIIIISVLIYIICILIILC
jgi:hypothetical protein